ncbi:MAG TPA: ADOP family duplicated permease [Gemmatimonadales bacterium]|nr:ADOP family duplicated permease [Gemmatimonadales bacterium]
MDTLLQDVRYALRQMRRSPVLATAIVLTIGLGLGAATAIFTTSNAALVEPLPYAEPGRLVQVSEVRAGTEERSPTSYPTLLDWRSRTRSVLALEGYDPGNLTVGLGDEARMLRGAQVTPGFFGLLGVHVSAGRDFLADEDGTTAAVAIVSERFARSVAAGKALNQIVTVNGAPCVIVGVLPSSFHYALLGNADIFVPLQLDDRRRTNRFNRSIHVVGRLQGNVSSTGAQAQLANVMADLASEYPDALAGRTVQAVALRDVLLGTMKPTLAALLVAVALLLVIMGANLALLMLTRYVERAPELALRSALGATRARVLRQLLLENLAPSLIGAALALAIGQMTTSVVMAAIPETVMIDMPYLTHAGLDATVIGVIVAMAIILAVGFGLGPALLMTKARTRAGDARTTIARGDRRLRRGLVAAQIALTMVLLVSSGLLVVSFSNLVRRDVGVRDSDGVVTAHAPLEGPRYQQPLAQSQFYEQLLARTAALPGVRQASLINEVPGGGGGITTFEPVDHPQPRSEQPRAMLRIVGGSYFATLGIPIVAGRAFAPSDRGDTPPVAVVSVTFARMLGGPSSAVGRRVRLAVTDHTEWEVVGVVGDVQVVALDATSPPAVYLSHLQAPENRMTLVLRTGMEVPSVANQVRAIVKTLDPGIPVYAVNRLDQQLSESRAIFSRRFPMILSGVFAVAALALTLMALYAICKHEVLTRRREFGIRLALGGSPRSIRRLVFSDGLLLVAVGIGAGAVVSTLVAGSLRVLLFGITATDWRVYAVVTAAVLVSAFLATLGPALRAGSVDPSIAMRAE